MIDIEEPLAGREPVVFINLLHTPHSKEHTNRGTKSKENIWFKVQGAVNHRNLPDRNQTHHLTELATSKEAAKGHQHQRKYSEKRGLIKSFKLFKSFRSM